MDVNLDRKIFLIHDCDRDLLGLQLETAPLSYTQQIMVAAETVIALEKNRDTSQLKPEDGPYAAFHSRHKIAAARQVLRLVATFGYFPETDYDRLLKDGSFG